MTLLDRDELQLAPEPLQDRLRLHDGRLFTFRPLAVEDERLYPAFDARLTDEDRRLRFFSPAHLSSRQIARFTQFDRSMAAAVVAIEAETGAIAGVSRLHRLANGAGEFAALVRSDLKRQGLGTALMRRIIAEADGIGVDAIVGLILRENTGMLRLARRLGFTLSAHPDDRSLMVARLTLEPQAGLGEGSGGSGEWAGGGMPERSIAGV